MFAALELGLPVPVELTLELLQSRHPAARRALLRPPHSEQAGDLLFHPDVSEEALSLGLVPRDPALRAAYDLLTGRLDALDHDQVRVAYDRADARLRSRLRAVIRRQGSSDLAWAVLHQPAAPRSDADWRGLLQTLLRGRDAARLWSYVLEAPAWWSHVAVRAMARGGLASSEPLFAQLLALPSQ